MAFSADCDLEIDAHPKFVDEGKQAINGKPLQFHFADAGQFRGGDASPSLRFPNREFIAFKNLEDLCDKDGLQLPNIRVRVVKITVSITTSAYKFHVVILHLSIPSAV